MPLMSIWLLAAYNYDLLLINTRAAKLQMQWPLVPGKTSVLSNSKVNNSLEVCKVIV